MSVNEKMTAIADRIRHYAYETGKLTLDDMANKIEMVNLSGYNNGFTEGMQSGYTTGYEEGKVEGIEEGKKAEYDAFWDNYQDYGNEDGRNYYYAFSYNLWNDTAFNPKYPLIGTVDTTTGTHSMFYANTILTDTKVPIIVKSRSLSGAFYRCRSLVNIRELNVNSKVAFSMNTFQECISLINLNITGTIGQDGFDIHWSTNLNKASIESIINALSADTSGLTVTFSETAVNNAFGINVDDASTYPEGSEYYNLRYSKPKWTFNYA